MGVSLYCHLSVLCVLVGLCVFVRVVSNQSNSKKTHYVSDLSKINAFKHKIQAHSKVLLVLRYGGFTCVDP